MKIGIYGGSFDPPHKGHVSIAKYIIKELNLDKLLIIPVGRASHGKENLSDSLLRYEMCQLAFDGIQKSEISKIEINSTEVSYTYKTLENVIKEYGIKNEYFEIIGEDSAEYFHKWKNYKDILEKSTVVILKRKGYTNLMEDSRILELENEYYDVSSTEIKERLKVSETCEEFLREEVEEFIKENNLYK